MALKYNSSVSTPSQCLSSEQLFLLKRLSAIIIRFCNNLSKPCLINPTFSANSVFLIPDSLIASFTTYDNSWSVLIINFIPLCYTKYDTIMCL